MRLTTSGKTGCVLESGSNGLLQDASSDRVQRLQSFIQLVDDCVHSLSLRHEPLVRNDPFATYPI